MRNLKGSVWKISFFNSKFKILNILFRYFHRILEMQKLEAASLKPFKTREEYLSHRLEIDVGAAKKMMGKQSTLRKTNITKVINVINFLLGAGYKGFHIYSCPRIFSCSIDTIVVSIS